MKRVIQLLLIAALAMLISCARAADTDDESSSDSSSRSVDIEIVSLASYIDSDTSDYTINLVIKNNGSDTAKNFTSSVKAIKDNALTGTAEVELFLTSADLEKDKNVVIKAVFPSDGVVNSQDSYDNLEITFSWIEEKSSTVQYKSTSNSKRSIKKSETYIVEK